MLCRHYLYYDESDRKINQTHVTARDRNLIPTVTTKLLMFISPRRRRRFWIVVSLRTDVVSVSRVMKEILVTDAWYNLFVILMFLNLSQNYCWILISRQTLESRMKLLVEYCHIFWIWIWSSSFAFVTVQYLDRLIVFWVVYYIYMCNDLRITFKIVCKGTDNYRLLRRDFRTLIRDNRQILIHSSWSSSSKSFVYRHDYFNKSCFWKTMSYDTPAKRRVLYSESFISIFFR